MLAAVSGVTRLRSATIATQLSAPGCRRYFAVRQSFDLPRKLAYLFTPLLHIPNRGRTRSTYINRAKTVGFMTSLVGQKAAMKHISQVACFAAGAQIRQMGPQTLSRSRSRDQNWKSRIRTTVWWYENKSPHQW